MKKEIHIAIIDSGINREIFSQITGKQISGYCICNGNCVPVIKDACAMKHGTICSTIVAEFSENAKFTNISVFNEEGDSSIENFCIALDWCAKNSVDVISMSTGLADWFEFKEMELYIKKLKEMGVVIVAACSNRNVITYPASLPEVIGVKYRDCPELTGGEYFFVSKPKDGIDIETSMPESKSIDTLRNSYGLGSGISNSLVTPYIAGLISNMIAEKNEQINIEGVRDMLLANSLEKKHISLSINNYDKNEEVEIPIVTVVCDNKHQFATLDFSKRLLECFQIEGYSAALLLFNEKADFYKNLFQIEKNDIQKQVLYYSQKLRLDIAFICASLDDFSKELRSISDCVLISQKGKNEHDDAKTLTLSEMQNGEFDLLSTYNMVLNKFEIEEM